MKIYEYFKTLENYKLKIENTEVLDEKDISILKGFCEKIYYEGIPFIKIK